MSRPIPKNHEVFFKKDEMIISKTDTNGKIIYCNEVFIDISGYNEQELLGKPHSILRHPDMPKTIYKLLWDTIQAKNELNAYVKNLCKDGSYYWVFANITPSFDDNDNIIGYFSARREPKKEAVLFIQDIYNKLLLIEKNQGMNAGTKYLHDFITKQGVSYEEYILSI